MKARQHHFTSCKHGLGGGQGAQVRATSEGMSLSDTHDLKGRAGYRAPRTLPPQPDEDTILAEFPVAHSYGPLPRGGWALTQVAYVGLDYTGRWGNVFAHSLAWETLLTERWAIDLVEWVGWKRRLEEHEDTPEVPQLPLVELDDIETSESFDLAELGLMVRERSDGVELLARLVAGLLRRHESRAPVVVMADHLDGVAWVGAALKCLPPVYANRLSFSTYQFDIRGCPDICATVEGTDFILGPADRQRRFFVLDLLEGQHSPLPDASVDPLGAEYAEVVASWLAERPALLTRFYRFSRSFDHKAPGPELVHALRLFRCSADSGFSLDGARLVRALAFATAHARAEAMPLLMDTLADTAAALPESAPVEDYTHILAFLSRGARESGLEAHRELVWDTWMRLFDGVVLGRGQCFAAAQSLLDGILADLRHTADLAERFLEPQHLTQVRQAMARLPLDTSGQVVRLVLRCLDTLGKGGVVDEGTFRDLTAGMLAQHGEEAVAPVLALALTSGAEVHGCARVWGSLLERDLRRGASPKQAALILGDAVYRVLAREEPGRARAFRGAIVALNPVARHTLLREYRRHLERGDDIIEANKARGLELDHSVPGFTRDHRVAMVTILDEVLDARDPPTHARWVMGMVSHGALEGLEPAMQRRFLAQARASLRMDGESEAQDRLARTLMEAEDPRVSLPARCRLVLGRCRGDFAQIDLDEVSELVEALAFADKRLLQRFLDLFLALALGKAVRQGDHGKVIEATAGIKDARSTVYKAYRALIPRMSPTTLGVATAHWIEVYAQPRGFTNISGNPRGAATKMMRALRAIFYGQDKGSWAQSRRVLTALTQHSQLPLVLDLREGIVDDVKDNRRGVLGTIGGSLRGLFSGGDDTEDSPGPSEKKSGRGWRIFSSKEDDNGQ